MVVEVKVPVLGESVTEATVAKWLKDVGSAVSVDEPLVELETDKVTLEVKAPVAGALSGIVAAEGTDVNVGALLCMIEEGAAGSETPTKPEPTADAPTPAPEAAPASPASTPAPAAVAPAPPVIIGSHVHLSPSVRRLVTEHNLDPASIPATGPGGRLMKGDIHRFLQGGSSSAPVNITIPAGAEKLPPRPIDPREEVVPMTKLRRIISQRLKDAQNSAAMLTPWNEVDMQAAMDIRTQYKDSLEKQHGVRLGFMSIFVSAVVHALKDWPAVHSEISAPGQIETNY